MFVSIDLCLVPIGVGTSLSPYIKECIEIIKNEGLNYELGANGTAIEGDWDKVFECVKKCHKKITIFAKLCKIENKKIITKRMIDLPQLGWATGL